MSAGSGKQRLQAAPLKEGTSQQFWLLQCNLESAGIYCFLLCHFMLWLPKVFFFLLLGSWFPFKGLRKSQCCSAQHCGISDWHLLFVSLCLSSTSDKGSFLLSVGCCEKSRLSDPQILQCSWSGAVFITIVDGRGCTISDIFWSTWHIVLWSPEDWESGKMLAYPISGSKWLYQK